MGQFGLAVLSGLLATVLVALAYGLSRRLSVTLRLALWAVLITGFVWFSPQVYYSYYRAIIPGLPVQSVVGAPPDLATIVELLSFTGRATLSAHSTGVLGWLMLAAALWRPRFLDRPGRGRSVGADGRKKEGKRRA